jgi:hypothetical protein
MLALLGLLGSSAGLGLLTGGDACGRDGRGSKNIRCGSGLGKSGSGVYIGPVEILVLGVPLGGGLLVGTAEFLSILALSSLYE